MNKKHFENICTDTVYETPQCEMFEIKCEGVVCAFSTPREDEEEDYFGF